MPTRKKAKSKLPEGVRAVNVTVYVSDKDVHRAFPRTLTLNKLNPDDIEICNRMRIGHESIALDGVESELVRQRMRHSLPAALPFLAIIRQVREQLES